MLMDMKWLVFLLFVGLATLIAGLILMLQY